MESPVVSPVIPPEEREMVLPPEVRAMSRRVKIMRFGGIKEGTSNSWRRLVGRFRLGRPVAIDEMLDARGFDESGDRL